MRTYFPYTIFPLGDTALTVDFGNCIDQDLSAHVMGIFKYLQSHPLNGFIECVPAYSSLTVFYNPGVLKKEIRNNETISEIAREKIEEILENKSCALTSQFRTVKVPVCYNDALAPDIRHITREKKISKQELISIHSTPEYRVYMLGFLPGFAYMGEIVEKIRMPRKPTPQRVHAGSVGIAGNQTGIYPINSPGGWHIIGRTPIRLYEKKDNDNFSTFFQPGDIVQFYSISRDEFENY
ncbi:MAG: 5-oxoprolinase subunit PxpB [Chitinophagaceae bacterium]|nr:5-oxoprolinase subunit PxpB [Chitinophagaceae bacterium]